MARLESAPQRLSCDNFVTAAGYKDKMFSCPRVNKIVDEFDLAVLFVRPVPTAPEAEATHRKCKKRVIKLS